MFDYRDAPGAHFFEIEFEFEPVTESYSEAVSWPSSKEQN